MKIVVPSPVVVLRPGDPIPVLFCATDGDQGYMSPFSDALQEYTTDEHGVIRGPIASTDPDLLGLAADRYLGFQILRLDTAGQEWAEGTRMHAWITAMRANHAWPDVVGAANAYLSADSAEAAHTVVEREPALLDVAWEPVIRWIGARTAAAQETADQATAVQDRTRRLSRLRILGREEVPSPWRIG